MGEEYTDEINGTATIELPRHKAAPKEDDEKTEGEDEAAEDRAEEKGESVKTGDSGFAVWALLLLMAVSLLAFAVKRRPGQ